jgi:hypothetical protein
MKATLLHQAGKIRKGATVDLGCRTGTSDGRSPDDLGGASSVAAPVYAVTDEHGQTAKVDTRDLTIVPLPNQDPRAPADAISRPGNERASWRIARGPPSSSFSNGCGAFRTRLIRSKR